MPSRQEVLLKSPPGIVGSSGDNRILFRLPIRCIRGWDEGYLMADGDGEEIWCRDTVPYKCLQNSGGHLLNPPFAGPRKRLGISW